MPLGAAFGALSWRTDLSPLLRSLRTGLAGRLIDDGSPASSLYDAEGKAQVMLFASPSGAS